MADRKEPQWVQKMKLTEEIRRFSTLYVRKAAKGSPYSAQEVDALFRIELEDGQISPLELSRKMGVSKPTVSRLIEQLSTKKVIEKISCSSDKRSYFLKLTPKGHDTLKSAYLYYNEPLNLLEHKLGPGQFEELLRLIALANEPQ